MIIVLILGVALFSRRGSEEHVPAEPTESDLGVTAIMQRIKQSPPIQEIPTEAAPNVVRQLVHDVSKRKNETVVVTVQQGQARFERIKDRHVLCRFKKTCRVPIEDDVMVYKKGFRPRRLQSMDLFDRRGNSWEVILRRP